MNATEAPAAAGQEGTQDAEYLARLKSMFEEARNTTESARKEAETDLDYYHGQQWTKAELSELKKRRQPPITYNLIRVKIESICGVEEKTQTSPKAWPRTPADEDAAEVATDVLRYVTDLNRFDKTRIDVLRDMLVSGTGGAIVEVQPKGQRFDIIIRKMRWETIVYDPFSRETDFSDARYLGTAIWMNDSDVIAMYGDRARPAIEASLADPGLSRAGQATDSYSDRPNFTWADEKRRRVLVVELYHREGNAWQHCVFTGGGVILAGPSSYLDADGVPSCPIELVSAYVNRENERYGLVRDMRSPQDEVNHRRSKLLHLLNTRQTWRKEGSIAAKDPQALRRELNKPDGDVVIAKSATWNEDVGIIDTNTQMQGQAELLQDAKTFLDRLGPNAGLMGRGTEDQSGRAILAQQQAGLAELATIFGAHNDWVLRIYRQIWARARQFWNEPMFIRVTDDIGSPKFVQVNEIVGYETVMDQNGLPAMQLVQDPSTGRQTAKPLPPQPIMRNRLSEMGVDLIVDRVEATANLQAEEFQTLADLARNGMPIPPQAIIIASSLRNKQQILDAIEQQTAGPAPDPAAVELAQRQAMAEVAKTEAQATEHAAKAQKTQVEAQRAMMSPVVAPMPGPLQ